MSKIFISAQYNMGAESYVNFPDDKTWGDVEAWFVKWNNLHVKFKGDSEWQEFEASEPDTADSVDWKRPSFVSIHPADEDDRCDYDTELDSSEH